MEPGSNNCFFFYFLFSKAECGGDIEQNSIRLEDDTGASAGTIPSMSYKKRGNV